MQKTNEEMQAYLLERIRINEQTDCWEWQKSLNKKGYACSRYGRPNRLAYEAFVGPIGLDEKGKTLYVCHNCDNRKCINPEHLWLGTQADNMQDMLAKGRSNRQKGINNPLYGRQVAEATKAKLSNAIRGFKHSEQAKEKIRLSHLGRKQAIRKCQHCGKQGGNALKAYHFDNCKFKP